MANGQPGRPRRALRVGESPTKLALRRLKDLERYYAQPPKLRWARVALYQARRRSLAAGVVFALTLGDLMDIAVDTCPALGIPLDYSRGRQVIQDDSPTVDRLRPLQGYALGNVAVISNRANCAKSRCHPEELMAISRWTTEALAGSDTSDAPRGAVHGGTAGGLEDRQHDLRPD